MSKAVTGLKVDRYLIKGFLIIAFILGVLQAQTIEHEYRRTRKFLDLNYDAGQRSVRNEACRRGFGRYEGTNFVWNTNVFESLDVAMNSVINSEKRAKKVADISIQMARISVESGKIVIEMHRNEEGVGE